MLIERNVDFSKIRDTYYVIRSIHPELFRLEQNWFPATLAITFLKDPAIANNK